MRPKRYPYYGNKKRHHEEIAELKKQIAVNKSMINHLERAIKKQRWRYVEKIKSYFDWKRNGEISSMNLFVICFTSAALLYVLTLPFVGQRAKKAHTRKKKKKKESEEGKYENLCKQT